MPPRLFKTDNYVSFNKQTNKSTCLICRKELCGLIIGNIKRHYEKMHNIKFTRDYLPKPSVNINTITRSKNQVLQLNKNEFLKCCIGLVAVKNLPLNIFNDERYFKRLINPYLEEYSLNLSSENMMDALEFWALRIRTYLKIKLHKKPLSLKLDVVGRHGKNILVIHVQQLEKYEIVVHTLGTIQLKTKPTSQTLKEAIWKCLKDYEIEGHQLYAVSSDSRGRSLKALQLIQDEMEENDMEIEENLQKPIFSIVFNGSYVIELAARIYFKTIDGDLKQCRQVIKAIHDRQMESMFLPSLDNSQRWKSTYDMVFSLKEFITNSEIEFEFEDKLEWLDSFLQTHEPLHVWSQQQHSEQYIVGDFYRDWLVCEAKLKQWPHNEYAMHLLEAMLELKQTMLDNEAFNAALYFDPRFNHLDTPYFSEERKKQAVSHAMRLEALMKSLDGENKLLSEDYEIQYHGKGMGRVEDPYNILEAEMPIISRNSTSLETNPSLCHKLENLAYAQRLPYSTNILEFWKHMQIKDTQIHGLLKVILGVVISQSSIERTFNALSTLLTKTKSKMSRTAMENMLLVKLNADILDIVEA